MTRGPRKPDDATTREARLKAALRANLSRRKAQGRARAAQEPGPGQQAEPLAGQPAQQQVGQDDPPPGPAPQNED